MQKQSSKSESTRKIEQNRSCWKILTMVKVNGQRSQSTVRVNGQLMTCADVAVWRHLGLTWQEEKQQQARVAREWEWTGAWGHVRRVAGTDGAWRCVERVLVRQKLQPARGARVMQFLAVLGWVLLGIGFFVFLCLFFGSWMHRKLISECCSTVGVTAVAHFWQWWLDEGEGSGRMPEMSTETRKSEEWLWYHVNNIKWERKTE